MEEQSPSFSGGAGATRPKLNEMEIQPPFTEDPSSTSLWDWGDLLDFAVDDHFPIFDSVDTPIATPPIDAPETNQVPEKVRKRDPRLTCSNFLAGRVPCACPELDEKLEEEEGVRGKKRIRTARSNSVISRCQVPGCEADISELKGYHKRHRVCLRCANAVAVMIDGENKRYCQQCGKFHLLSDFDEGKRSCRRKLERHNDRRRRKPNDSKVELEKELQGELHSEAMEQNGEDCQIVEKEGIVDHEDRNTSTLHSGPSSQNPNSDSRVSVGTHKDGGSDDSKLTLSPSNCNNTFYSSACPTGRISFKLYDWNPAEFPRRLRHQIFEWLASMPVELEGYIRPGCTILTAFLAMPTFMWGKILEDPESYVRDFVTAPGNMLSKRGPVLVYLNNTVFHVLKDGMAVNKIDRKGWAPRLHYVHPTCFEAGKPIEFVACGTNLLQPKFRLLVSFSGKYLAYDHCVALPHGLTEECSNLDHQLCKIFIPHVEPHSFGPAFIEVENESGLSNFIPILVGDSKICSEINIIQQRFEAVNATKGSKCDVSANEYMTFSEFITDVGWLLRKPLPESFQPIVSFSQIQRLNFLLDLLLKYEAWAILRGILPNLRTFSDKWKMNISAKSVVDTEMRMLLQYMDNADDILCQKIKKTDDCLPFEWQCSIQETNSGRCSDSETSSDGPSSSEDLEKSAPERWRVGRGKVLLMSSKVYNGQEKPKRSCGVVFSKRAFAYRSSVLVLAAVVCLGVCAIIIHPNHVREFAVTVRNCLSSTARS